MFDPPEYVNWKPDSGVIGEFENTLKNDSERAAIIASLTEKQLLGMYTGLLRFRLHDIALRRWVKSGILAKAWLGTGEEAVTIGNVHALDRRIDKVGPMIRNAGACHEMGISLADMLREYLATADSPSRGKDLHVGSMSNGVIVVEDSWIQRSRPVVIHGVRTRVLAPEELVASKLFVDKRERFDGADIAHVIYGTYGSFDWDREMELVGEHWEMLLWSLILFHYVYPAQAHYVPDRIWQELLRRFQCELLHRDPRARFRGSLVDERMFAIDVSEWGLDNLLEESRAKRLAQINGSQKCGNSATSKKSEDANSFGTEDQPERGMSG